MKLDHFLTPHRKINSKWINDLNVRPETIKLLEENIGKTLSNINHRRILYDPPHRVMEIKAKINKWDLIKLKSFYFHYSGRWVIEDPAVIYVGECLPMFSPRSFIVWSYI